jgi:hypothetical protein
MEIQAHNEETNMAGLVESETTALDIIRTETVLSRLPVHNLAKKGRVDIQILRTTPSGQIELKWEVSYSDRYGQARQLAYRLDTIIVNQRIDAAGKPLPKLLRLGSLNEICAELGLATDAGKNAKDLKRAFLQNASAFITAKFNYQGNDKAERRLEAGFTRYSVIFTGEKLPDGRKADAVYIAFNEPFWEVLNNAPVRPLDRAYMKGLPPAAQRFYEIISYKIFSALKNKHPHAKISYSEYCMYSAQQRSSDWNFVRPQMYQVHKPHVESGYLASPIRHEKTIDRDGNLDWVFIYTPGPRAQAEFDIAHGRKPRGFSTKQEPFLRGRTAAGGRREASVVSPTAADPALLAEFTKRGITEAKAIALLATAKPDQDLLAQLELGEHLIKNAKIPITNPPGFLVRLIESNTTVPSTFETTAKRRARQEREHSERQERSAEETRRELEGQYEMYCSGEVERYLKSHSDEFDRVRALKWQENRQRFPAMREELLDSMSAHDARREIRKRLPLPTLEEFMADRSQAALSEIEALLRNPESNSGNLHLA